MELFSERLGTLPQPNPPSTKLISGQALENSTTIRRQTQPLQFGSLVMRISLKKILEIKWIAGK